ncbi:MAG: DUF58 domain-containing protein [Myxococcota bacterium]|nr:DUF58 domain-containing protein [Myxococcota bacterium]
MLTSEDLRLIQKIHLQLGKKVDSPFSGEYRSAFRGQGMEFEDVRLYVPGDDVRRIDWNVTARTGMTHVKEFREEREMNLMIVADVSASMRFGRRERDKRKMMAYLVGALSFAALRSGDRVGLLKFASGVEEFIPPRKGRGHAWSLIQNIFMEPAQGLTSNLDSALEHLQNFLKRKTTICIISDFWVDATQRLKILSHKHAVHGFLIHDPLEGGVATSGLVEVRDAESGKQMLVDCAAFSPTKSMEQRLSSLRTDRMRVSSVSTEEDPILALLRHFRLQG